MKRFSKYLLERRRQRYKQRKILTLEERVQAIRLYDQNPVYMRVASELKCSWEQIKNVVQNRDAILSYYAHCQTGNKVDTRRVMRQQKINFLGQAMCEYVRRVYCQIGELPDDALIKERALAFRNLLNIPNFLPNKAWITDFKNTYKLNSGSLQFNEILESPASVSLNCKDIISYCRQNMKHETQKTETSSDNPFVNKGKEKEEEAKEVIVTAKEGADDTKIVDNNIWIYLDDDDDDEISENEEGPTIDFGDYEDYMKEDEMDRKSMKGIVERSEVSLDKNELSQVENRQTSFEASSSSLSSIESSRKENVSTPDLQKTSPGEQLTPKQTTQSRINTCDNSMISGEVNDAKTTETTQERNKQELSSHSKEIRIESYADALNVLQTLEEFALLEEDFRAINLISQLEAFYQSHLKRKEKVCT